MRLIADLAGMPLQDDIVRTAGRRLRLDQDILATFAWTPISDCAEPVVIDQEAFAKIHDYRDRQGPVDRRPPGRAAFIGLSFVFVSHAALPNLG